MNSQRAPGERFADYRRRQGWTEQALRRYLRAGRVAEGYVNGPHKSHRPKVLEVKDEAGEVVASVRHPGTLVKEKK